jgi:hypothetical protein
MAIPSSHPVMIEIAQDGELHPDQIRHFPIGVGFTFV